MNAPDAFRWLMENQNADEQAATEQNAQALNEAALRQWEQARLFFDVFGTGRGPELLLHLRDKTIEVPLFLASAAIVQGGEVALAPADWAHYREGQNSLVRHIEGQIRIAQLPLPNVSAGKQEGDGDE